MTPTVTLTAVGEAEWERLRRLLDWSDAFWLCLVVVRAPAALPVLRDRLRWNRAAHAEPALFRVAGTSAELASWADGIAEALCPPRGVTWIEASHTGDDAAAWLSAWRGVLNALNQRRDSIRGRAGGLILVLPESAAPLVAQQASDLWSVRGPSFLVDQNWVTVDRLAGRGTDLIVGAPLPAAGSQPLAAPGQEPDDLLARQVNAWLRGERTTQQWLDEAVKLLAGAREANLNQLAAVIALRTGEQVRDEDPARARSFVANALALDHVEDSTRLALLHLQGDTTWVGRAPSEAEPLYVEALELSRRLFEQLGTPESARDVSVSLDHVGGVRVAAGDWPGAQQAYEESLALRRRLSEQLGTPQSARDLVVSLLRTQGARSATGHDQDGSLLDEAGELSNRLQDDGLLAAVDALRD